MPKLNSNSPLRARMIVSVTGLAVFLLVNAGPVRAAAEDGSDSMLSTYAIPFVLVLLLVGLIVYKRLYPTSKWEDVSETASSSRSSRTESATAISTSTGPSADSMVDSSRQRLDQRQTPQIDYEQTVYGAYRIDQEVSKLVMGKPHRMDVMGSRAPEDRRAIEASLMKALDSIETTEESQFRVRRALEEYGFVARQSATLLLGRDAWERSSAARVLGQVSAPASLPFLMEALHDGDPVVRNQAISSLGELKMPAAIGALLDIARRHPDIPASLLSETLSACSVESLGYLDSPSVESNLIGDGSRVGDLAELESLSSFEDLPDGHDDEEVSEILAGLKNSNEKTRVQLVQQLGLHSSQHSVSALGVIALNDLDAAVRAAAVSALGAIDHESVFAPVLIALSDESREVRAAAARSLTSLHFDRANAYVRVMESTDTETLHRVAQACITTGIVAQGVDRLASEDRRQAYEAFSLFSLLARAGETEPILKAIENHPDEEVRICAVRVLNAMPPPQAAPKLRELVAAENLPENVRTAILEVLYKLDQDEPIFDMPASDNVELSLHNPQ